MKNDFCTHVHIGSKHKTIVQNQRCNDQCDVVFYLDETTKRRIFIARLFMLQDFISSLLLILHYFDCVIELGAIKKLSGYLKASPTINAKSRVAQRYLAAVREYKRVWEEKRG